jgi:hypothetical protein
MFDERMTRDEFFDLKEQFPGMLLLIRGQHDPDGVFAYERDAVIVAQTCNLEMLDGEGIRLAAFSIHDLETNARVLRRDGHQLVLITPDPSEPDGYRAEPLPPRKGRKRLDRLTD